MVVWRQVRWKSGRKSAQLGSFYQRKRRVLFEGGSFPGRGGVWVLRIPKGATRQKRHAIWRTIKSMWSRVGFIGPIKTLKIDKPQNIPLRTRETRRVNLKAIRNHLSSYYLSGFLLVPAEQESIKLRNTTDWRNLRLHVPAQLIGCLWSA